jgi:hypothetical protein
VDEKQRAVLALIEGDDLPPEALDEFSDGKGEDDDEQQPVG